MNANDVFGDGSAKAIDLWRRMLEVDIELEEAEDGADLLGDLGEVDEDELAEVQAVVFSRLGITDRDDALVAAFMVDLEKWRADASAPAVALARRVGSILPTVKVSVPELRTKGLNELVRFECDLDKDGRICNLSLKITADSGAGLPPTVALIEPNGKVHTARISSRGLARFSGLAIEPTPGSSLTFEFRR